MFTITVGKTDYHFNFTPDEMVSLASYDVPYQMHKARDESNDRMTSIIFYNLILLSFCKVDGNNKPKEKSLKDLLSFQKTRAFSYIWATLAYNNELADRFVEGICPTNDEITNYIKEKHLKEPKIIF